MLPGWESSDDWECETEDPSPSSLLRAAGWLDDGTEIEELETETPGETPTEDNPPTASEHARQLADSMMLQTRPRTSTNPKTQRATQLRAEKRLVQKAKETGDDKLIAASLNFKVGQRSFPALHAAVHQPTAADQQLRENVSRLLQASGKHNRHRQVKYISEGLPSELLTTSLGISKSSLKKARESRSMQQSGPTLETQQYSTGVSRSKITDVEQNMLVEFYEMTTDGPPSGSKTLTRILEMREFEWECSLYADYPALLRRVASRAPFLLSQHQGGKDRRLTKFQASIRAAVHAKTLAGFDPAEDRKVRLEAARKLYARKIAVSEGRVLPYTTQEKQDKEEMKRREREMMTHDKFDPANYHIRPVDFDVFKALLKQLGKRYTTYRSPKICPLCEHGPVNEAVLDHKKAQVLNLKIAGEVVPTKLDSEVRKLTSQAKAWYDHKAQLAAC